MDVYFMGIDQSFTSTGIVILNRFGTVIFTEIIQTDKKLSDFQRSWNIFYRIYHIIQQYGIKYIGIEGLAFGKFGNATRSLAILQGVLVTNLLYLKELGSTITSVDTNVEIITPTTLKKFATGAGRADKTAVIKNIPDYILKRWREQYHAKCINDLADAYFLAKYMLQTTKLPLIKIILKEREGTATT